MGTKCLDGISFDVMALHRLVQSADLAPGLWQKPLRKDAEVQTGPVESMASHEQLRETIEATAKATEHAVRQAVKKIYVEQLQTTKVKMEKNFEVKLADVKKHYETEIQDLRTKLEDKQLHKESGILRKHMQDYDTKLMDLRSKIKEMTGEKQKLEQCIRRLGEEAEKKNKELRKENGMLREQVGEMFQETLELEQYILTMHDDDSDDDTKKEKHQSKAKTRRQRQKEAARNKRQRQKQQRWCKKDLRSAERERHSLEMQEIQTNVFDKLRDSIQQPHFEASMSTMLQGIDTESAFRSVWPADFFLTQTPCESDEQESEEQESEDIDFSSDDSES